MNAFGGKIMALRWFILSAFIAVVLLGCYDGPKSKNPISEPDPHSIDQALLGTWGLTIDGKKYAIVHFEIDDKKKGTIKAYLFNYRDTSNCTSDIFFGHFSSLGKSRFLNLYESPVAKPECSPQAGNEKGKAKAPSYLFIKYEIKGKTLSMSHMNSYFVGASIIHNEIKGIVLGGDCGALITDESANIAEYIRKHENDIFSSRLEFDGKFALSRVEYQKRELEILKKVNNWPLTRVKHEPDYDKIIEMYPDDVNAYYERGMAYKYTPNHYKVIHDFSKIVELSPKNADAHRYRGEAYKDKGDYDLALQDFGKAIELNPKDDWAYSDRGEVYKTQGDFDSAIRDYSKAIELSKFTNDGALIGRGEAYYASRDYDSAIQDFSKVLRAYSANYPDVFLKRSDAYRSKGDFKMAAQDYDSAIMDFTRAIELDPQAAVACKRRGDAYKVKGNYENAFQDYSKAIELAPKDEQSYVLLVAAAMKISRDAYEASMAKLRKFVDDNPSDEWVRTISKYYLGMDGLTEWDVLNEANNAATKEEIDMRLCGAYYYLGEAMWFKGDRVRATGLFLKGIWKQMKCDEADSALAAFSLLDEEKL